MIWNYKLGEIENGYAESECGYECVVCQMKYAKGRIYEQNGALYDAEGAVKNHVLTGHGTMASYLLQQDLGLTGLTEIQRTLLSLLLCGKTDSEIGRELGIAQSTVRNHRFKLREKEKQAKLFLALMDVLGQDTQKDIAQSDTGTLEEIHASATMVDDRYQITDVERKKTVAAYIDEKSGTLKQFPAREKKKIIILSELIKRFERGKDYPEKEINCILREFFQEDVPTLRRALIEYGFMERTGDCKIYRVKA